MIGDNHRELPKLESDGEPDALVAMLMVSVAEVRAIKPTPNSETYALIWYVARTLHHALGYWLEAGLEHLERGGMLCPGCAEELAQRRAEQGKAEETRH